MCLFEYGPKPKITIGVCAKNCQKTIKRAIESIVCQDFPHELMETIFVDDGSKDQTLSIINEYVSKMDMQVKVFHHDWKGLGPSRNVVADHANGDYIIWVDCDMVLTKGFVRKQVEFMDKNPNVGIAKGMYGIYDTNNLASYLENLEAIAESLGYMEKTVSNPLGTGGAIYRVAALKKASGFDEGIKGVGEDMDAEFKIREAGWSLRITSAVFYEIRRTDWNSLWKEYLWHGMGGHRIFLRIKGSRGLLYRIFPPVSVLIVLSRSCRAYKLVHKKTIFLLPFHWVFKRSAWCLGFVLNRLKQ